MKARILIAEDDTAIRHGLMATLESEGYEVIAATDGVQAVKLFPQHAFDLVILDVMMPGLSGYDVCRELRSRASVPILFLTAKGEEIDKVVGLKLGGDDYITKPFGVNELLARVEAHLRRVKMDHSPEAKSDKDLPDHFKLGTSEIDRRRYEVCGSLGEVSLTNREMKLAECFARHPGEVLSRDKLLNEVWGYDYLGTTRTLDQHIAQLRRKFAEVGGDADIIQTVHGVGYCFVPPSSK